MLTNYPLHNVHTTVAFAPIQEEQSTLDVKSPSPQASPSRSPDTTDNPQPTYAPPDILDSLYAQVKKPKRYPAPSVPAPPPPPPENGSESPSRGPPNTRESVQPSPGKTRPGRPPPSRPSRPPAGEFAVMYLAA